MQFVSMLKLEQVAWLRWIWHQVEGGCYVINRKSHFFVQLNNNNCTHNNQTALGFTLCNYLTVNNTIIP